MLMIGRALQGMSSAMTWTAGLALVVDTVDEQHVGQAMGWIGLATSLGVLLSPVLGGVVYGESGYYPVFAMCFAILAVDIILRLMIIEVKEAGKWKLDQSDVVFHKGASAAGSAFQSRASDATMSIPASSLGSELSSVKAVISKLVRRPRLLAALWGTLAHATSQTAFDSTLPLLVSSTFGWDSLGAGLVFLPLALPTFLGPLVGAVGDRYGSKWLTTGGFLFSVPFLMCLRFVTENSLQHKILLCSLLTGSGIAAALCLGPLLAEITWAVRYGDDELSVKPYALAYGFFNLAYSGGALLGPIWGGTITEKASFGTLGWSLALLMFVTGIVNFIWVGPPPRAFAEAGHVAVQDM